MARTAEAHRRQQERKRLKLRQTAEAPEWQVWRSCEICDQQYCANNYADHKVRVKRWKGLEICAYCRIHVIKNLPRLVTLGVIKIRDEPKPRCPGCGRKPHGGNCRS